MNVETFIKDVQVYRLNILVRAIIGRLRNMMTSL